MERSEVRGGLGGAGWGMVTGVVVAVGCGGQKEAPAVFPTARSAPEATAKGPETAGEDGFSEEVERALELVGQVRELAPKHGVKGKVIGREEMVARIKKSIREEVPKEVIAAQEDLLFALHTVPASFDYESAMLRLVEDQLAGFYDPEDETMYLGEDLGSAARWATLAHELVHALQDQHYDLGDRVEYREDGTDEQSAIHALAEGDATSAMFDVLHGRPATEMSEAGLGMMFRGTAALSTGAEVPGLLKRSLVAPYIDGVGLVHWARRRGGWDAVDAVWQRPPKSTEQVLHPEKYESDELPIEVEVPKGMGAGWEVTYHDVLGEQSLRLVFEEWMPRFRAEAAASGWGGDEVAMFGKGGEVALAWRIVFDDEVAARRAAIAFTRGVLGSRREGRDGFKVSLAEAEAAVNGGEVCVERPERGPFVVVWRRLAVGVVAGPFRRTGGGTAVGRGGCKAAVRWGREVAEGVE